MKDVVEGEGCLRLGSKRAGLGWCEGVTQREKEKERESKGTVDEVNVRRVLLVFLVDKELGVDKVKDRGCCRWQRATRQSRGRVTSVTLPK